MSKNKSWSDMALAVSKKYKNFEHDPKKLKNMVDELRQLQQEQEQYKQENGIGDYNPQEQMANGGNISWRPFAKGGIMKQHAYGNDEPIVPSVNATDISQDDNSPGYTDWIQEYNNSDSYKSVPFGNFQIGNKKQASTQPASLDYDSLMQGYNDRQNIASNAQRGDAINPIEPKQERLYTPQFSDANKLNPKGASSYNVGNNIANGLGVQTPLTADYWKNPIALAQLGAGVGMNAYDLLTNKTNMPTYQRLTPNLISRENERRVAARHADESRNIAMRNLRQAGADSNDIMANQGVITSGVNEGLGDQLTGSYDQEYNANAGIKNDTNTRNAMIQQAETEARAKELDSFNQQQRASRQGILSQANQYGNNAMMDQQLTRTASMPTSSGYVPIITNGQYNTGFRGKGSDFFLDLGNGKVQRMTDGNPIGEPVENPNAKAKPSYWNQFMSKYRNS